jgi:transposase InsO family protein
VLSAAKETVAEQVEAAFYLHRRRYGARRLATDLKAREGYASGRLQVRAMMRRQNLVAIQPRCFTPRITDSRHTVQPSPNLLLEMENAPRQPREVVVGDITYLPLLSGKWGYLASRQGKFNKRIVGWAVEERMTDELVTKPLRRRSKAEK